MHHGALQKLASSCGHHRLSSHKRDFLELGPIVGVGAHVAKKQKERACVIKCVKQYLALTIPRVQEKTRFYLYLEYALINL